MYEAYNRTTREMLICENFKTLFRNALTMLVVGYKYGDLDTIEVSVDGVPKYTMRTHEHRIADGGFVEYELINHKTGKTYAVRQGGIR